MAFRITHESTRTSLTPTNTIYDETPEVSEWICPTGWSSEQAIESFEKRFPSRRVVSCELLTTSRLRQSFA